MIEISVAFFGSCGTGEASAMGTAARIVRIVDLKEGIVEGE